MNLINDYVDSKKIKVSELEERFKSVKAYKTDKINYGDHSECLHCGDKLNNRWLPSEPWTSCQYCWVCNSLNFVIHPDAMGGNYSEYVEVYQQK